jgi:hypothetical protein
MFGIPIDGPANVFCDNHGVVSKNVSIPESTLMKKHNASYQLPCSMRSCGCWNSMSWKGRWRNKSCRFPDQGFNWQETMENLLAPNVVGRSKVECQGSTPCD